ncbi:MULTISPECIES: polysaccharide deacetylase family protein [unclassified Colwellia]|uniref:polysaccharide deacetylase family protein n=1 Tax=unclassified Colwellia TaxID=196834 RepID=UPI0015F35DAF|nr:MULTISPECIES: polysaccharide deacetylase family protein [unclassified Colwellia]MBA6352386.1 polysaccharide deacetylase family protein [Colwellia sp. BRX9-1]MBA6355157.1 polysaccharide deacetylase family protein [Colwellia sp. BRX8-3]MBA6361205.1 polysaccharide deacetylase family protein [Colwellia sp. BRX8-6]MBA6366303.1 polysaccharide deacetylase family protein [Colwellia sp. BRX8-5]MBA6375258.1 polysaccharide deacetylase family protein [Colwellia sp. BRX8-2]
MKFLLPALLLSCFHFSSFAAVILQYHHVSDKTPASTSISPEQFQIHMQYLSDNNFNVIALSDLMNSIKKQQPITDKTVAITFDDAYLDILLNGKPILDKFNYPFTIFINPAIVERGSSNYLTWQQLKTMADQGVIIANHGMEHDSMARISEGLTEQQWLMKHTELLLEAESIIKEKTGQSWRYFAYPYGEYTPAVQQWVAQNDFIAFSQQSGAVGLATDLTSVPRFPASKPYDQISSLRDKLKSLPFNMTLRNENASTIVEYNQSKSVTFDVVVEDFLPAQLNCYISGLGRQKIEWQEENSFTINYSAPLPIGRVRCNCTAPSISEPGRYYWYSKPWFVLKEGMQWYPL